MTMACGGDDEEGKSVKLGDLSVSDHGTKDVSGSTSVSLEADDFYFEPTFLKGTPGQKTTLTIENESSTLHNFSVPAMALDKDIAPNGDTTIDVVFPDSGVLLFVCKYHTGQGMNGEMLAG